MAENEFVSDSDECLVTEAINLDIEEVSIYATALTCATILKNNKIYLMRVHNMIAERIALCHLPPIPNSRLA